jgi:hypothetical protein
VHALTEDKCDDIKDRFYEKLERLFDEFPKCHTNTLSEDFNANAWKKIF